jgi:hypothetical protein
MEAVLVDMDDAQDEQDMRLGQSVLDVARSVARSETNTGVLLALAVATHGKELGLLDTPNDKLKFAEGWGAMLGYAILAVTADDCD